MIFEHFHDIGAEESKLTDSKDVNRTILSRWFSQLVIQNKQFPLDMGISFVLKEFFQAILHGRAIRKGNNLANYLETFREWIREYEPSIRRKYFYQQDPEKRPKLIPESATKSNEEKKIEKGQTRSTLERIYGKNNIPESLKAGLDNLNE